MLVLTRKLQEQIVIGDNIKVTVLRVKGNTVRLGIEAPRQVRVVRAELPLEEGPPPAPEGFFTTSDAVEPQANASASRVSSHMNRLGQRTTEPRVPRCPAPLAAYLVGMIAPVS